MFSLPNIISLKKLGWGEITEIEVIASVHIQQNCTKFLLEDLKERDQLGYLGIYGKIILKWVWQRKGVMKWNEFT
jgi:hypothetical protein